MTENTRGFAGAGTVPRRPNSGQRGAPVGNAWDAVSPEDVVFRTKRDAVVVEALRDPSSVVGEELRLLGARVRDICKHRRISCLAVTSALPGEGKSTLSVGLAGALARQPGRRVLLIEVDLRRPSLARALGLQPSNGLGEWLHGYTDDLPIRTAAPAGFSLLVAGQAPLESPEILGSPRMDALLKSARGAFDYVVLDAMPLVPVTDATFMQDLVDGFLLVVRYRMASRAAVEQGLAKLRPGRVLGLVMNDYREILPSYTTYAYRRYGMAYGPSDPERDASPGLKVGRSGR